jgi:tRNA (guanine37-N1)-methyltransferase
MPKRRDEGGPGAAWYSPGQPTVHIHIITLFPEMFASPLSASMLRRAQERGCLRITLVQLRDFAAGKHQMTDDYPYGGSQGMVMKPEPIVAALDAVCGPLAAPWRVLLSPQGRPLTQATVERLAARSDVVLLCGRYEGVDERVRAFVDEELSVGDYVLSGGEPAAIVLIDAVARLVPGALGNVASAAEESFSGGLLEYPQYTRPEEFRGLRVPEVLLSGDHAAIAGWRRRESLRLTLERRPDLLAHATLTDEDRRVLAALGWRR